MTRFEQKLEKECLLSPPTTTVIGEYLHEWGWWLLLGRECLHVGSNRHASIQNACRQRSMPVTDVATDGDASTRAYVHTRCKKRPQCAGTHHCSTFNFIFNAHCPWMHHARLINPGLNCNNTHPAGFMSWENTRRDKYEMSSESLDPALPIQNNVQ